ncbi:methyltransferase domain-containing protein [Alteraurantiacibacter aestuarii]|uniref:methyltransferase domain-containing protein n=1 Tax=Alteraurantiacibacter aestuarii TaxID=650004 RepID=UPI0031E31D49
MASAPPTIFSNTRRKAARRRMLRLQQQPDPARFIIDDMVDDVIERLGFVQADPARSLVIGDYSGRLSAWLGGDVEMADIVGGESVAAPDLELDLERPFPSSGFDLIVCLGLLDSVNDLPGALIHLRAALAPGGMVIASFVGAGSLPALRQIMLAADGDRPSARVHPMVDVRAGAQLLQRAGWSDPVVDSHRLNVRYGSMQRLVGDLRAQGLGSTLASAAPHVGKSGHARALRAFDELAGTDGRLTEQFEILTLTGRRR